MIIEWFVEELIADGPCISANVATMDTFTTEGVPPEEGSTVYLKDWRYKRKNTHHRVKLVHHVVMLGTHPSKDTPPTQETEPEKVLEHMCNYVEETHQAKMFGISQDGIDYSVHKCEVILEEVE